MNLLPYHLMLLVFIVLAWPAKAQACSCEIPPNNLASALKSARDKADAIFLGRVVGIEPVYDERRSKRLSLHRVTFDITETFKGTPLKLVTTYRPDGIGCGYQFDSGAEYLVYALKDETGGLETSMCSRTQFAEEARFELAFLRSGKPPTPPMALRRELVRCTPCDVNTVTPALVCGGAENCESASPEEANSALKEGRPFWAYERRTSQSELKIYGVASDGRAFELVQQPHHGAEKACMQRVHRRWCERLSVVPGERGARPEVVCHGPTPDDRLCDEAATRQASWGPVESMKRAECTWKRAGAPVCELRHEPAPLDPGQATRPGMLCTPGDFPGLHRCLLVPDAALAPPER